jgi:ABC-type nitrate/sulfonate/bicarbonate transport system substrate-binding protein
MARPDQIWFTRCPVPTATGLAYRLGWLQQEFAPDGIRIDALQEAPREFRRHHYDHALPSLIREGGSLLALAARAQGAPTRLIGLTWIDEWQAILVRPGSGIATPADLKGKRVALPAWIEHDIPSHVRGSSIARGMTLQGIKGALRHAGLTLDDVRFVEVGAGGGSRGAGGPGQLWDGIARLAAGEVDAVYVKGASAAEAARRYGVVVGIDLDHLGDRRFRVNNGTPRPITVHEDLLNDHFDLVVRFLAQTLHAADWAADHLDEVHDILKGETQAGDDGVREAYRNDFHRSLHPALSDELLSLFEIQKNFCWQHGFQEHDIDLAAWADPRPLAAARGLLNLRADAGLLAA